MTENKRQKYPRTPHLPWSPGATGDDLFLADPTCFEGKEVVVTLKMDGENTTLYPDAVHARSVDSRHHPSRAWVKGLHGRIAHLIPAGWRLCGENLYARHSIAYDNLASYFYLFSIWNEQNDTLSWDETVEWASLLDLVVMPILWRGTWNESVIRQLSFDTGRHEGYVVRTVAGFAYVAFGQHVAKWVRANHVQSDDHWMHRAVIPNRLATDSAEEV